LKVFVRLPNLEPWSFIVLQC